MYMTYTLKLRLLLQQKRTLSVCYMKLNVCALTFDNSLTHAASTIRLIGWLSTANQADTSLPYAWMQLNSLKMACFVSTYTARASRL
jgi:hypothetical protein